MYKAIKDFIDLQDHNFRYKAGDVFPRFGKETTASRIEELLSNKNKRGEPVIADFPDEQKKKRTKKTEE